MASSTVDPAPVRTATRDDLDGAVRTGVHNRRFLTGIAVVAILIVLTGLQGLVVGATGSELLLIAVFAPMAAVASWQAHRHHRCRVLLSAHALAFDDGVVQQVIDRDRIVAAGAVRNEAGQTSVWILVDTDEVIALGRACPVGSAVASRVVASFKPDPSTWAGWAGRPVTVRPQMPRSRPARWGETVGWIVFVLWGAAGLAAAVGTGWTLLIIVGLVGVVGLLRRPDVKAGVGRQVARVWPTRPAAGHGDGSAGGSSRRKVRPSKRRQATVVWWRRPVVLVAAGAVVLLMVLGVVVFGATWSGVVTTFWVTCGFALSVVVLIRVPLLIPAALNQVRMWRGRRHPHAALGRALSRLTVSDGIVDMPDGVAVHEGGVATWRVRLALEEALAQTVVLGTGQRRRVRYARRVVGRLSDQDVVVGLLVARAMTTSTQLARAVEQDRGGRGLRRLVAAWTRVIEPGVVMAAQDASDLIAGQIDSDQFVVGTLLGPRA